VVKGARAQQAAGVIHSDFEKGFIRAKTIAYDDYIACNGERRAREAGKFRSRARSMWCRTATSCTSALTCEARFQSQRGATKSG